MLPFADHEQLWLTYKAMQRTARQPAIQFISVCHPPMRCVARFSGLAVADLVSR